MTNGKTITHYLAKTATEYAVEHNEVILKFLETGYDSSENSCEVNVNGSVYKVLKREQVTVFYDADGNTLFDVENRRIAEEYTRLKAEEHSEAGSAIASIEREAFEYAVSSDDKEKNVSSVKDIAKEKLETELKNAKDNDFADPIIKHLLLRVDESEALAKDMCRDNKTWEKCSKYIYEQAKKHRKGSSSAVRDDVVYEWAEDYYHKEDKDEDEKKAKETTENKKTEKKAKEITSEPKESKSLTVERKTEEKTKPKQKRKPKPKKGGNDMEGQIDMFSFVDM